ncbi:hypothetical protein [Agrobacterium radiobacter]|nr:MULTISPECIES: hypothetical protein [Agrobacterium tumefaciens complex]
MTAVLRVTLTSGQFRTTLAMGCRTDHDQRLACDAGLSAGALA